MSMLFGWVTLYTFSLVSLYLAYNYVTHLIKMSNMSEISEYEHYT